MLTRLKVSGFKNLVNIDVRFGPFTCIAGANAVGKSNLFDAIRFLGALANGMLTEAPHAIRGEGGTRNARELFYRQGDYQANQMSFETEMIVPKDATDIFGQKAPNSDNFLRYRLVLGYRPSHSNTSVQELGELEILEEQLQTIPREVATAHLGFKCSPAWLRSVMKQGKNGEKTILKTIQDGDQNLIMLKKNRQEHEWKAATLPRTVVSATNEHAAAIAARQEMKMWGLLQLEPSALRKPDNATSRPYMSMHGEHLPATLYRLAHHSGEESANVYQRVTNTLGMLIDEVHGIEVDHDEQRNQLTLNISYREGTHFQAKDLSDGTLRFLALATLMHDEKAKGVICLEEPENGIHPLRIAAMMKLLQDIAVDTKVAVGEDNPMRQVIISTHSPEVVRTLPADTLLGAKTEYEIRDGVRAKGVQFRALPETWRTDDTMKKWDVLTKGTLLEYLTEQVPIKHLKKKMEDKSVQDYIADYP